MAEQIATGVQWVVDDSTGAITGYRRKINGVDTQFQASVSGAYPPAGGIPKTDLSAELQTAVAEAISALQPGFIAAGTTIDKSSRTNIIKYLDGVSGRPTLAQWQSSPSTVDVGAALLAACAEGPVYVPSGTWLVDTLGVSGAIDIQGDGDTTVITSANSCSFLSSGDLSVFNLDKLKITTTRTNTSTRASYGLVQINYASVGKSEITRCTFDTAGSYGNSISMAAQLGKTLKNIKISGNSFVGFSAACEIINHVSGSPLISGLEISGNQMVNSLLAVDTVAGFGVSLSGVMEHVRVFGNLITDYAYCGIEVVASYSFTMRGEIFNNVLLRTGRGIYPSTNGAATNQISKLSITGNVVVDSQVFCRFGALVDSLIANNIFAVTATSSTAEMAYDYFGVYKCTGTSVKGNLFYGSMISADDGKAYMYTSQCVGCDFDSNRITMSGSGVLKSVGATNTHKNNFYRNNTLTSTNTSVPWGLIWCTGASDGTTNNGNVNYFEGNTLVCPSTAVNLLRSDNRNNGYATGTKLLYSDTGAYTDLSDFSYVTVAAAAIDYSKNLQIARTIVLGGNRTTAFTLTLPPATRTVTVVNQTLATCTVSSVSGSSVAVVAGGSVLLSVTAGALSLVNDPLILPMAPMSVPFVGTAYSAELTGGFATPASWTQGAGWSVSGGQAVATAAAPGVALNTVSDVLLAGQTYLITYTIGSYTSGDIQTVFEGGAGSARGTVRAAAGTYSELRTATATGKFYMMAVNSALTATITSVSLTRLLPAALGYSSSLYWDNSTGQLYAGKLQVAKEAFSVTALTSAATVSLDVSAASMYQLSPASDLTINAINGVAGPSTSITLVLKTIGTTSRTVTFGSGFISTGTVATGTVADKYIVVRFQVVDGVAIEIGRTIAM